MRKSFKTSLLCFGVFIVAGGSFFSWYAEYRVDARDLVLFQIFVQAVDAETGAPLSVGVRHPKTRLAERLKGRSGKGTAPVVVEMTVDGYVRVSWVDLAVSEATVLLTAEGYAAREVPLSLRKETFAATTQSGLATATKLELHPVPRPTPRPWDELRPDL